MILIGNKLEAEKNAKLKSIRFRILFLNSNFTIAINNAFGFKP